MEIVSWMRGWVRGFGLWLWGGSRRRVRAVDDTVYAWLRVSGGASLARPRGVRELTGPAWSLLWVSAVGFAATVLLRVGRWLWLAGETRSSVRRALEDLDGEGGGGARPEGPGDRPQAPGGGALCFGGSVVEGEVRIAGAVDVPDPVVERRGYCPGRAGVPGPKPASEHPPVFVPGGWPSGRCSAKLVAGDSMEMVEVPWFEIQAIEYPSRGEVRVKWNGVMRPLSEWHALGVRFGVVDGDERAVREAAPPPAAEVSGRVSERQSRLLAYLFGSGPGRPAKDVPDCAARVAACSMAMREHAQRTRVRPPEHWEWWRPDSVALARVGEFRN